MATTRVFPRSSPWPSVLFLAGGAVLIFLGVTATESVTFGLALIAGIVLCGMAVVLLVRAAFFHTREDAVRRALANYGCKTCGYTPKPEEIDEDNTATCPVCGRLVHMEE